MSWLDNDTVKTVAISTVVATTIIQINNIFMRRYINDLFETNKTVNSN